VSSLVLLALLASSAARAHDEVTPWRLVLTPPALGPASPSRSSGLDLAARDARPRTHPLQVSLQLSVDVLRLAVHGDYRPGLAPFLGTSFTALGGLRLRF
jgi:hypothetical protein